MLDTQYAIRSTFGISRRRYRENMPIIVHHPREKLSEVFARMEFKVGAEVGVKRGDYSISLCRGVPDLHLYCVDMWGLLKDKYEERRARYLRQARQILSPYKVTFIEAMSLDAVGKFKDVSLDFVYIDAAHDFDNAVQDIIQWSAKVRSGGIVAAHDYYQHRYGGVVPAVDAYVRCHQINPWYVTYELMPSVFWVKP